MDYKKKYLKYKLKYLKAKKGGMIDESVDNDSIMPFLINLEEEIPRIKKIITIPRIIGDLILDINSIVKKNIDTYKTYSLEAKLHNLKKIKEELEEIKESMKTDIGLIDFNNQNNNLAAVRIHTNNLIIRIKYYISKKLLLSKLEVEDRQIEDKLEVEDRKNEDIENHFGGPDKAVDPVLMDIDEVGELMNMKPRELKFDMI